MLGFFTGVLFINFQLERHRLISSELTRVQIHFLEISKVILKEDA
jgi:hypothetical protein